MSFLEPFWEKKFIFHSFACRRDKGAHRAIKYLQAILHRFQNAEKPLYYLQTDIYSFFVSIDKAVLFKIISRQTNNPNILWLAQKIIFDRPADDFIFRGDKKLIPLVPKHKSLLYTPAGKGLPIGNLTSQFFANVYLNDLDQFVKHCLKCRYYFRYMDDLLLLHQSPKKLSLWKKEIDQFLQTNLALNLHPKKQVIQPVQNGINFLGYITKPEYSLSRQRVVASLKRKLHYFNKILNPKTKYQPESQRGQIVLPLIFPKEIPNLSFLQKTQASINSYYGHFQHCHSRKLRQKIYQSYFKELQKYLEPKDENFSSFVINPQIKELLKARL